MDFDIKNEVLSSETRYDEMQDSYFQIEMANSIKTEMIDSNADIDSNKLIAMDVVDCKISTCFIKEEVGDLPFHINFVNCKTKVEPKDIKNEIDDQNTFSNNKGKKRKQFDDSNKEIPMASSVLKEKITCLGCKKDFVSLFHHFSGNSGKKCKQKYSQNDYFGTKVCEFCDYETTKKSDMFIHESSDHAGLVYYCKQCYYKTNNKNNLTKHVAYAHQGKNCKQRHSPNNDIEGVKEICKQNFENNIDSGKSDESCKEFCTKKELQLQFQDESDILKCKQCDFTTTEKFDLKFHEASVHLEFEFTCQHCDFKTTRKPDLLIHVSSVHSGLTFDCNQCKFKTKFERNLTLHVSKVHVSKAQKEINCTQCDFKTKWKSNLTKHVLYTHTSDFNGLKYGQKYYEKNKIKLNEQRKLNYKKNKLVHQKYYETNKDKLKEQNKQNYEKNKEKIKEQRRQHYEKNKEQHRQNKEKMKEQQKQNYGKNKRTTEAELEK